MNKAVLIFLSLISLAQESCGNADLAESASSQLKKELIEAINQFNTAFKQGDIEKLESMVTENYIHTNGSSKAISKDQWFNYLKKRSNQIKSGSLQVLDYQLNELDVQLYDNMAIVTGKVTVSQKNEGVLQNNRYRITNIWVLENGKWKRAGFHDGKIQP